MKRVVLTGATGFVGRRLLAQLESLPDVSAVAVVRRSLDAQYSLASVASVSDIGPLTDWSSIVTASDVVIHVAARVHVRERSFSSSALADFRRMNVDATINLARQAAEQGARRFIFISSIKVNGENTYAGRGFTADDLPSPADAYGTSKLEAERALTRIAAETEMEIVIIRPPLVYGPGVKANFLSIMNWIYQGIPLPLGSIVNRRSLIAVDNLVDLIVKCIDHRAAANQTFLASDGEDLSTPELLRDLGTALGREARLFAIPTGILEIGARMINRSDIARSLCRSLQVDMGKTRSLLGWAPPISTQEGLKRAAEFYLENGKP